MNFTAFLTRFNIVHIRIMKIINYCILYNTAIWNHKNIFIVEWCKVLIIHQTKFSSKHRRLNTLSTIFSDVISIYFKSVYIIRPSFFLFS